MFCREWDKLTLKCWEKHTNAQPQDLSSTYSLQDQWIIITSCQCLCMTNVLLQASPRHCVYILHVFVWVRFTDEWFCAMCTPRKQFPCSTWGKIPSLWQNHMNINQSNISGTEYKATHPRVKKKHRAKHYFTQLIFTFQISNSASGWLEKDLWMKNHLL